MSNLDFAITAQMHEHALQVTPFSGAELYQESVKLVEGIIKVADYYGFDKPILGYDVYNIEAEAMGQRVIFPTDSSPQIDQHDLLIKEKGDLDRLRPPKPARSGRMPYVVEANRLFHERTGIVPALQYCAPFSLASAIYGFERLIMDLYLDPEFVHRLMEFITDEVLIPWISFQQEQLPEYELVLGADALASPPNLNLALLQEFVVPYLLRIKEACGQNVGVVNWWGESYLAERQAFLMEKVKVSPDNSILRVQDPDLEKIDPQYIVDFALANNLKLTLGVSAQLLSSGPVEDINDRVKKYMESGLQVPYFNLYLCNISSDTPEDNIRTAINSAREYYHNR